MGVCGGRVQSGADHVATPAQTAGSGRGYGASPLT